MKILIHDFYGNHDRWYSNLIQYLYSKGHSVKKYLRVGHLIQRK